MIPSLLVFLIGTAYAFTTNIPGGIAALSPEATMARAIGAAITVFALLSRFPSLRAARYLNCALGFWLVLSPLALYHWDSTALVIQAVVGFWTLGLSLLSRNESRPGGGWHQALTAPSHIETLDLRGLG